ncbi:hypothetical protein ACFX13_040847 [Malus domestica]
MSDQSSPQKTRSLDASYFISDFWSKSDMTNANESGKPLQTHPNFSYHSPHKTQIPKIPKRFVVFANNGSGLEQDSNSKERVEEKGKDEGAGSDGGGSDDDLGKNQRPLFGNIRWGDLLLDPDPNDVLAVGLTGLLTWASVRVLSIALAMLVAAG